MWCLRCYPNGKSKEGDFFVQLQLCGLPVQTSQVNASWRIKCHAVNIDVGWTTNFDYAQSCWGWGHKQLSYQQFLQCDQFTISVDIVTDEKINIIAMAEWQKFVDRKKNRHKPSRLSQARFNAKLQEQEE